MQHRQEDNFLFDSLSSKSAQTARKVHIRRLFDVFQLCLHRHDIPRARRAWAILARCKEVNWLSLWSTAVYLVGKLDTSYENIPRQLELLRELMLHHPSEREVLLQELVFRLIIQERYRDALDELELYLPSFPYQDNPVLHTYAGLLCFYLAQEYSGCFNESTLRDAKSHFERALTVDADNVVVQSFMNKVYCYSS
ncbi:rna polymerase i transcription factor subunit rrn11 [Moniliophthora roreri MCA 2997]|uniref:Rna polymerase i transcription factor subunit rrn11 n=1 Tax=Moniliophthora roreri (strain MCA 2997) TaxID=1381753 RepID=V2YS07_MONRO|nr:rna polymerase i transcription factor subunit rrn11 [Moniliophthora roreri MCA 2997]